MLRRLKAIAIGAALMALASPALAEWMTIKDEPDPFEPSKSTFIAGTVDIHAGLVGLGIRCLQGGLSLVVTNGGSNAATGDPAHLKIVADGRPPRNEGGAIVTMSTAQLTVVQFGDAATVGYLKGAKKVSVRYTIGGTTLTETFEGGGSLDDVIQKATKACGPPPVQSSALKRQPVPTGGWGYGGPWAGGVTDTAIDNAADKARAIQGGPSRFELGREATSAKEDARANDALVAANQTADWYYKDGNEDGAECHAMSGTPKQFADAAVRNGATNLETTGSDISDVVIAYGRCPGRLSPYGLKDKCYSYYFYKSHEKCAYPFGMTTDNTRSDFSRISHDVDADRDKADQTLADEALKHATDKGPWWLTDGTKMYSGCKLSTLTPMGDALSAKAKGARNIEIDGSHASNVRHLDVVVEYDFNGKRFYNDYYPNKFCDDTDPPSESDKAKAIGVSSRIGESWYVDYFSDKMQCVETTQTPKELAAEAKKHDATDIAFTVPLDSEKAFLYLWYGVGDQGHMIGFYEARDACTDDIKY